MELEVLEVGSMLYAVLTEFEDDCARTNERLKKRSALLDKLLSRV